MNQRSRKTTYSRNKRKGINQRIGRESAKQVRDRRERERLASGGRHRIDVSEREAIEVSRLHAPLVGVTAALNAQLQTPEAWASVWADVTPERRR